MTDDAKGRGTPRSAVGFIALVAGVALCVKAGANLLVPAAYIVAVFAVERQPTTQRYLLALVVGVLIAVAAGAAYSWVARRPELDGLFVSFGLIIACVGRLRRITS